MFPDSTAGLQRSDRHRRDAGRAACGPLGTEGHFDRVFRRHPVGGVYRAASDHGTVVAARVGRACLSRASRRWRTAGRAAKAGAHRGNPPGDPGNHLPRASLKGASAIVLHNRAITHFNCGEFPPALTDTARAEAIYQQQCTGVSWELDTMRTFALWSLGYLGDVIELRRRQEQLVKDARDRKARYALTNFLSYTTLFAPLAADNVEEARGQLEEARQGWTSQGYYVQTHAIHVGQILVDFYLDRPQAVWGLLNEHWWRYRWAALLQIQIIRIF